MPSVYSCFFILNDNIDNKNNVLPQAVEAHVALPDVVRVVSVVVRRTMLFFLSFLSSNKTKNKTIKAARCRYPNKKKRL